jgi:hypothetical protein
MKRKRFARYCEDD